MDESGRNNIQAIPTKTLKKKIEVPNLLLSYTYFLNSCHTCHLSVGYNTDDFVLNIILYKNNVYHILYREDWILLSQYVEVIDAFLADKCTADFVEFPNNGENAQFKMTVRKNTKCLVVIQNNKKLIIDDKECLKLLEWIVYMNTIVSWYGVTSSEVQRYYERYLQICFENKVDKLLPHQFFTLADHGYGFFNNSRIFNELPILCSKKLHNDLDSVYNSNNQ